MDKVKIRDILDSLGNTSDEVAAKLKHKGCKGRVGVGHACPVTNYIKKRTRQEGYHVTQDRVIDTASTKREEATVFLPDAVRKFVMKFDAGKYEFLAEE